MDKKEAAPARTAPSKNVDQPYYRRRERWSRRYRQGMASETMKEAHRRMFGPKSEPGRASDYMDGIHECVNLHPDLEVYIIVRESERNQAYRRNHDNYAFMETGCEGLGIGVRDCIRVTCSGTVTEQQWRDVLKMVALRAFNRAVKTGKTVGILAYSADRLLRNVWYKNTTPNVLPTRWEYRQLKELTHGVPLLTWVDPDTPPNDARGGQSQLGQQTKGNKGGGDRMPGWRKRRKAKLQPKAREMLAEGATFAQIAERLGVSIRTAWLWANAA